MTPSWWQGLILGLVQGLTEFLPVSSSGHLVLAEGLLGYVPHGVAFEVALHLATLLAVFVVYWERIGTLVTGMVRRDAGAWRYALLLVLASLPAAAAGLGLRSYFESSFHSFIDVGVQFLITAAILWSTRWAHPQTDRMEPGPLLAIAIGIAQAVAILPAISRSGTTIAAALWGGMAAAAAAEFSFLMSIIVIAGSGLLEARQISELNLSAGLVLGFLAALASGVVSIRFLIRLMIQGRFHAFAPYCALVGIFTLLWFTAAG